MGYNYLSTESDEEHAEREGADETQAEYTWCDECMKYLRTDVGCEHDVKSKGETILHTLICSCGYHTCGLITRYGLPEETFHLRIEPIPSQVVRDRTALEIRSDGEN